MTIGLLLLFILFQLCSSHFDTSGCGIRKKCLFVPTGCQEKNNCQQIFSYSTMGDDEWTEMELFSSIENPNNNYIAVGFSEDDVMGDDHVTHCAFVDGSEPEAHLTFNFGKSNAAPTQPQDQIMEKESLQLIHAHKGDDGMYCSFKQKTAAEMGQFVPVLKADKVIFLARGNARKPRALGIHSTDPASPDFPYISDQKINVGAPQPLFSSNKTSTETPVVQTEGLSRETRFFLVKLHAILMIIGWMVLVPIAVLSARYLRDHFPQTQPGKLKMWFHLHRTLNGIAIFIIVLSALIVFFAKDFVWKGPTVGSDFETNTSPSAVHTLLGVIATGLAIIQPILALIRCAPEASARPVFNYVHRSIGLIALVGALIAILIGANAFKSLWTHPDLSFWIVVFFLAIGVLDIIIFEVLTHLKKQPSVRTIDMEMRNRMRQGFVDGPVPPGKIVEKKPLWGVSLLFILFVLFAISVATGLIILLFL